MRGFCRVCCGSRKRRCDQAGTVCESHNRGNDAQSLLFKEIRKHTDIKIHVLIRPRFGDFCYTDEEFLIIKEEVKMFRELGADGAVVGILRPDGTLNKEQLEELMEEAGDSSQGV